MSRLIVHNMFVMCIYWGLSVHRPMEPLYTSIVDLSIE